MYWATPDEVAEWRERQTANEREQPQPQVKTPAKPAYRSFTYRDENGHRVSATIRCAEPEMIEGYLV